MSLKWANFMQPANFAFVQMNGNADVTTIALTDTYQAMDVSDVSVVHNEQWSLTDAAEGILTYDGDIEFAGMLAATISALKTTSIKNYRFAVSINGAIPVFASARYMPMEVKTTKVSIPMIDHVDLFSGDTFQIMVAGDGHSDNITITDAAIHLEFMSGGHA